MDVQNLPSLGLSSGQILFGSVSQSVLDHGARPLNRFDLATFLLGHAGRITATSPALRFERPSQQNSMFDVAFLPEETSLTSFTTKLAASDQNAVFQNCAWLPLWQEGLGGLGKLRVLVARRGAEVLGVMSMVGRQTPFSGMAFEIPGGAPERILGLGILALTDYRESVGKAFADFLVSKNQSNFQLLHHPGCGPIDPAVAAFENQLIATDSLDCKRDAPSCDWKLQLRPGPDGEHQWSLCLRQASTAARSAFRFGDFALDPGDGVPTHTWSNLKTLLQLNPARDAKAPDSGRQIADMRIPLNALAKITIESPEGLERLQQTLGHTRLQVPLLLRQAVPIAGAIVLIQGHTMYVGHMGCLDGHPEQSLLWLLHWAMVQSAAQSGIRFLRYSPQLAMQVADLRCEALPNQRLTIRKPRLVNRVQKILVNSTHRFSWRHPSASLWPASGSRPNQSS